MHYAGVWKAVQILPGTEAGGAQTLAAHLARPGCMESSQMSHHLPAGQKGAAASEQG